MGRWSRAVSTKMPTILWEMLMKIHSGRFGMVPNTGYSEGAYLKADIRLKYAETVPPGLKVSTIDNSEEFVYW